EELRHGLKSKARPKRTRLDRRDEIGGKPAGQKIEIEPALIGKDASLAAKPRGRGHDELEPHLVAEQRAHLAAHVGKAIDQSELERTLARPEFPGEQILARLFDLHSAP